MADPTCLIDPQRDYLGLNEAKRLKGDIEKLAADMNDLHRQNSGTHERLWDELHALKEASAVQREQYKQIIEKLTDLQSSMGSLKTKVDTIESKPAKRYEDIVKQVISLIVAAVFGMILAKILGSAA